MNILVLNAGSNSLKFDVIRNGEGTPHAFGETLVSGAYENIGKPDAAFTLLERKQTVASENVEIRDHGHATELLLAWLRGGAASTHGVPSPDDLARIGHRVVHGADLFHRPTPITADVIRQIEALRDLAPLHNDSALKVIHAAQAGFGPRTPMVAVFDTAFHRTIPEKAALYGIPLPLARRHKIRRYGFHGISHRYLMLRYSELCGRDPAGLKLITLHLEGGSSVAAIDRGCSVDTSMGFTPLEGLVMGTRCGDLDPALVLYLMRKENMDPARTEQFLNKECGLLGLSGLSADTRKLREHLSEPAVQTALDVFAYRVRKYVGAYLAALGGADAIVAGGGISENTALLRERIFSGLERLGIHFDTARNAETIDRAGPITAPESSLPVWVVPTDESLMIAREVAALEL